MLDLTGKHIADLGDEDLRLLVTKLCEAELQRHGLPASAVLAGGNQTAKDGGIDVAVQLDLTSVDLDFIPRPQTGFQVKCEDMPEAKVLAEMRPNGALRDSIKALIAAKGAYVIVCSKGTVSQLFLGKRIKAMRTSVADQPGADDLKVDFYDRDRLARWVRQYPGVELWVRSRVGAQLRGWQGYAPWAGGAPDTVYLHDETARMFERRAGGTPSALTVTAGIERMRAALGKPGQVSRLVGLSGTGKTRLVQALFEPVEGTSSPLERGRLLYTDLGHSPDPSAREMLLRLGEAGQRAMVIVDNCNPNTHRTLTEVARQFPEHLSLLTVEYDVADEDSPEATDVFELAPSSGPVLESILARLAPHLDSSDRTRIVDFAGGNARIALALAGTVAAGETLGTLNDGELFRRLFRQGQADDEGLLRAAEACSLVYSFDGEDAQSDTSELRIMGSLIGISGRELFRHVNTLMRRDLVQSRSKWRAVLPPALANRLARSALQSIPRADIVDAFMSSERLLVSFSRRLEYLHDSEVARAIAARWMEDEQLLAKPEQLDHLGRKLFINLAPLNPKQVLGSLQWAFDADGGQEFVTRQHGHLAEWSALLRHLAYEPASFDAAASLLLTIAELDTSTYTNCRDAWHEPFRIGLSGTLALPTQRMGMLGRLMASATGRRRELVWEAIEATLEANFINSSHDFSFGARPHGYGWEPSNQEEVAAWYEEAFRLFRLMWQSGTEGRERASKALASRFRELWHCGVHKQLAALAREFASQAGWPAGWVAIRSTLRFDSAAMDPETLSALRELEAALAPSGLLQEVRTYALGHAGGYLDVADALDTSDEEEDQNPIDAWQRVDARVTAMGETLAQDEEALVLVLPELFAQQSGRQMLLGQGLGRSSDDPLRHWTLLREAFVRAEGDPYVGVLAGFAQGVKASNPAAHTAIMDALLGDPKLEPYYPAFLAPPADDADADRLIAAMHRGVAQPFRFTLRTNLRGTPGLSLEKFYAAVDALSSMEGGLVSAIDELYSELNLWKPSVAAVPVELKQLAQALLNKFSFDARNLKAAYRLNELAKMAFVGADAAEAAAQFAGRFAVALDDYRTHGDECGELACTLFRLQPRAALEAFLAKPVQRKHFGFRARFVARHGSVVQCAPDDVILDWVRRDPATRAPLVASEITIVSTTDDGATVLGSLAAHLLEMAPDKAGILKVFGRSFHPSHWSGSLGQTLAPFVALAEALATHSDPVVVSWATEALTSMRRRIERDRDWNVPPEESFE